MGSLVLVDTTIWVDALRQGEPDFFEPLKARDSLPATTGLVVQEVLQGVRTPKQLARASSMLADVTYLRASRETHRRAAALYRNLRRRGITVPTIDIAIAQTALDHGASVWSLDPHFDAIASACKLRLHRPSA
jgi:hypothetical protein